MIKESKALKAFGLLAILFMIICIDLAIRLLHGNSILIEENVKFGSFTSDVTRTFHVEKEGTFNLETYIEVEDGMVSISIIDPNNEVIYVNNKSSSEAENIELTVWKGEWKYRVQCENATNGKYTILCKKKD